ncbi:hypothetical protein PIB30_024553 [Stylosanthes scabra]|uniref:Uncharacterized protein n=1 Tax=Stylosanthes scabra TaxID=79078 RepID=A0ABU6SB81_9FABA|nr:hypothetical protein [Stylosanthes scabra]
MRDKERIIMARNNNDIKYAVAILMFEMLVCCVIAKLHENNPLEESSPPPTLPEIKPPPEDKYEYDNDESELPVCIENCKGNHIRNPEKLMDCIEVSQPDRSMTNLSRIGAPFNLRVCRWTMSCCMHKAGCETTTFA